MASWDGRTDGHCCTRSGDAAWWVEHDNTKLNEVLTSKKLTEVRPSSQPTGSEYDRRKMVTENIMVLKGLPSIINKRWMGFVGEIFEMWTRKGEGYLFASNNQSWRSGLYCINGFISAFTFSW